MKNSFNPNEMALLKKVIDDACLKLGCDDAQREIIAARVFSCITNGPLDYDTLFAIVTFQRDALSAEIKTTLTEVPMPLKRLNFRGRSEKNVLHRMSQAERARILAAKYGPSVVADLLEMHAQLCEQNASRMASKGQRRQK